MSSLFTSENHILKCCDSYSTPFYLYDEETIKYQCCQLKNAFKWNKDFQNYFAVKANPNPHILKIIKEQGFGVDCSSYAELLLAESAGFNNEAIFFTSNNTAIHEYRKASELSAIINLDDVSHLELLYTHKILPDHICFRYNPGSLRRGNEIIGSPVDSKFGITKKQLFDGYKRASDYGCKKFSLHTMIVSNCLDLKELLQTAQMMFELVKEIKEKLNVTIHQVNLGGGIGIPYKPSDAPVNIPELGRNIMTLYNTIISNRDFPPLRVAFECGRFITGPAGVLVTKVINKKITYKQYLGVDASIANFMRPAMYGAYHHITHIESDCQNASKENSDKLLDSSNNGIYDVIGSLCENNDKLAVDRFISEKVKIGDILVIHDTGAHCSSMGFNYNGKLRCPEYLRQSSGQIKLIRRAETYSDLFATLTN